MGYVSLGRLDLHIVVGDHNVQTIAKLKIGKYEKNQKIL